MLLLQLPETCHVVIFNFLSRYSQKILRRSSCSVIGLIYSQGWQLNVTKLSVVNACALKTQISWKLKAITEQKLQHAERG